MFIALGKDRDAVEVRKFMSHLVNSKAKLTEWNRRKMVEALLRCGEMSEGLEVLSEVLKFQRIEKPRLFYEEVTAQLKNSGQFLALKRVDSYFAKRYPEALSAKLGDSQEVLTKAGDTDELVRKLPTQANGGKTSSDSDSQNHSEGDTSLRRMGRGRPADGPRGQGRDNYGRSQFARRRERYP